VELIAQPNQTLEIFENRIDWSTSPLNDDSAKKKGLKFETILLI